MHTNLITEAILPEKGNKVLKLELMKKTIDKNCLVETKRVK